VLEVAGVPRRGVALAPLAVHPSRQRQGIGSRLVRDSLPALTAGGEDAVLVLGIRTSTRASASPPRWRPGSRRRSRGPPSW
jgi:ribosomal protein S18 acetylase RimI-like enzyme